MNCLPIAAALALAAFTLVNTASARVSAGMGQPGFYGQLNVGGYPRPPVLYRRPLAIQRVPLNRAPIYLHVPPVHVKNWRKRCRDYNACGERVWFVPSRWYNHDYVSRYRQTHNGGDRRRHQNRPQEGWHGHGDHR